MQQLASGRRLTYGQTCGQRKLLVDSSIQLERADKRLLASVVSDLEIPPWLILLLFLLLLPALRLAGRDSREKRK